MRHRRAIPIVTGTLALALAFPLTVQTKDKAPQIVIVNFGDPVTLVGTANQVVVPDEVTIRKGGSVIFVVNGGGHGIAIYPVSQNTTRDDITAQLCAHDPVTNECTDPAFANADRTIRDGANNAIIVSGTIRHFSALTIRRTECSQRRLRSAASRACSSRVRRRRRRGPSCSSSSPRLDAFSSSA
jgi:hypothetical protein